MENLEKVLEALLFLAGTPLEIKDISEKLDVKKTEIEKCAEALAVKYSGDSGIHILNFNHKLQFCSNPDYAEVVANVLNPVKERELSASMLETIAIIAYKQPITRLEIEEIRGVSSDYALQTLSRNNLIEVVGRKDAIGKPLLFGTTDNFLKKFKLKSIDELPDMETLLERLTVISSAGEEQGSDALELYHRDEYADNQISFDESIGIRGGENEDIFLDEELPDFLQGEENIEKI